MLILSEQYTKIYESTNNVPEGDASAINMGPGGVLEVQPDGQYPEPPAKDENAEGAVSMESLNQKLDQILALLRGSRPTNTTAQQEYRHQG